MLFLRREEGESEASGNSHVVSILVHFTIIFGSLIHIHMLASFAAPLHLSQSHSLYENDAGATNNIRIPYFNQLAILCL